MSFLIFPCLVEKKIILKGATKILQILSDIKPDKVIERVDHIVD